jgi:ElaB/YqjD/DUF883 family membrane-anchored ribosome-binding protein
MADSDNIKQENIQKVETPKAKEIQQNEATEKKEEVPSELQEIQQELVEQLPEEALEPSGKISEKEKAAKEKYIGGKTQATTTQKKAKFLPPPNIMKKQVKKELKKEIKYLQRKIRKVMHKKGNFQAYEVNILIAKLRKLKEILKTLAYATQEVIKELWIRFVKQKTI